MINSKYFGLSKFLLFLLLLFELLQFKMPSKPFHNYYTFIIICNTRVSFWLECTLIQLFHFLLSPLSRNLLLLFL